MARLNDLPGPTESLEALKRRFVRQNREIARVNSLQSLRIQGLEAEITHLLKENAILKEQVISLSQDAHKYEAGRYLSKDIHQYKEKLAAKLYELNSLINDLGKLPEKFSNSTHSNSSSNGVENYYTAGMSRRSMIRAEDNGRLPTIAEDKFFPRKTLEYEEAQFFLNVGANCLYSHEDMPDITTIQDPDSPNIGTPPIAHFDVDQSPGSEARVSDPDMARYNISEYIENLERPPTRSPAILNNPQEQESSAINTAKRIEIAVPSVISGAKRKFSATDEEDNSLVGNAAPEDDFQFTRSVNNSQKSSQSTISEVSKGLNTSKSQQKRSSLSKRKVLEPKSTNMIASSPRRRQVSEISVEKSNEKKAFLETDKDSNAVPVNTQRRSTSLSKPRQVEQGKRPVMHENNSTMAALDSLDSLTTQHGQPKSRGSISMDEPAVADAWLLQSLPSRQSRRARGAVSYTEPNLRDKMRRATNELVDAVMIDQRRTSTSMVENPSQDGADALDFTQITSISSPKNDVVPISLSIQEDEPSRMATTIPTSDNSQKLTEIPISVITERKRRTLSANTSEIKSSQEFNSMPELKQKSKGGQTKANRLSRSSETDITNSSVHSHKRTIHRNSSNADLHDKAKPPNKDIFANHEQSQNLGPKIATQITESITGQADEYSGTRSCNDDNQASQSNTHTLAAVHRAQASRGQRAAARRRSMLL
ncbi:hypothetical protein BGW36DRAFT_362634 [Talaromyces proteolyticus]|uniref:Shugoshin C-terminal domain-containing protein n=1 Tax=Talaromyces proteolyticus TaxID=1131652 RepID=A0AAD4KIM1_9EURO|nr:uncharacterized protein BGW36DRAFT_362634 [Talaromyces proteolyticus]KAH8693098.1 hypothetical protein BGW36DRAFT_362634 [Talaromyces proteolyticus]